MVGLIGSAARKRRKHCRWYTNEIFYRTSSAVLLFSFFFFFHFALVTIRTLARLGYYRGQGLRFHPRFRFPHDPWKWSTWVRKKKWTSDR